MKKINLFQTGLTILLIIGMTTAIYLYANGYRIERNKDKKLDLTKTGMVSAKSMPEGASVYLDGILLTATNDSIAGIEPGTRRLKIIKKGFVPWEKDINVYAELVTDITAVLITQSPRLEPLTNTGALNPSISPTLSKLAYFTKEEAAPGVNVVSLSGGFFRSTPTTILKDTRAVKYSDAKTMLWSYDEKNLLIETTTGVWYLVDIDANTAQTTNVPDTVRDQWREKFLKTREDFIKNADVTDTVKALAISKDVIWAPDEKKFLSIETAGDTLQYKVYNLENPIPVGENIENIVFTTKKAEVQPQVSWYADSFHLILTEGNIDVEHRGKISFIRIDGTNKTEIYNNTLYSDKAFSTPSGDKVIILTSFKSSVQTDLYSVSIR